ncbi:unnamed protein product [Owenia fusiformis]|uniref:Uncharacterized protein n=1 Tax=Owenia fusiformis TaxID=6347 RepID=A0A8J1TXG8_OWEFU|nr:unnamed protein product [Owenia fusiformis]
MATWIKLDIVKLLWIWSSYNILRFSTLKHGQSGNADTMSVIIDGQNPQARDYIHIVNPPGLLQQGHLLHVQYLCSTARILGLEIQTIIDNRPRKIFQKAWKCSTSKYSRSRSVKATLPKRFGYRPGFRNALSTEAHGVAIRAWVVDTMSWKYSRITHNSFEIALAKESYKTSIAPPFERPVIKFDCPRWDLTMAELVYDGKDLICPKEEEVIEVVKFPAALSGSPHGVHRMFPEYKDKTLLKEKMENIKSPRLTVVAWLYVVDYCPTPGVDLCSIMHRLTWDGLYISPLLFFTKEGKIHVQVVTEQGINQAALTSFIVPRNQWIRIVFTLNRKYWQVDVNHGENWKQVMSSHFRYAEDPYYNDTQGLFIFGGSEAIPSFKGYIGQATYYRRKVKFSNEVPLPSIFHPMFELELGNKDRKCQKYMSWVNFRLYQSRIIRDNAIRKNSCFYTYPLMKSDQSEQQTNTCSITRGPRRPQYHFVNKLILRTVMQGKQLDLTQLGDFLYENATSVLENDGWKAINGFILSVLKQASCYGNHDATYMLSVILNNGLMVKSHEIEAHSYLMLGALENHRLSLMALGNKLNYGLDGMPWDQEQAYVYYKNVADATGRDKEEHKGSDIWTEHIRLTDEAQLDQQTDEKGDLFLWIKHQAQQGVFNAQQQMARLLHFGSQGLQRNLEAAVEYYRAGAETQDPTALYDYGVVLMRGQGTKKNKTAGLENWEQSAKKGNMQAMTALGWYALNHERNYTKALEYLEAGFKRGMPDAAYNLGHMHHYGLVPGQASNKVKAFEYYSWAASRGQWESGIHVATFNIRGGPPVNRSPRVAVDWARYIAEFNPVIGKTLHKALKAYRYQDWSTAMLYYMVAADTGIEVGNFNMAYLCDENKNGLNHYIEKECVWRYYNLSTLREPQFVNSYALIKMGDHHWYGCRSKRNVSLAVDYYSRAVQKGDPQAIFNLAFLVEQDVTLPASILDRLHVPKERQSNNVTILLDLYSRCAESRQTEAYLPCKLAFFRVQFMDMWVRYQFMMKLSSIFGAVVVTSLTLTWIFAYIRRIRLDVTTV